MNHGSGSKATKIRGEHIAPHENHLTLVKNVSIFNGTSENLIRGKDVVLKSNTIFKLVATGGDETDYDHVIDGKGGYLSPGLIDMHWHMAMGVSFDEFPKFPIQYAAFVIAKDAKEFLMRGFTTCRDAAGPTVGVARAIDQGLIVGPRMYPSETGLSQYSGHIDFRNPNYPPKQWGGPLDPLEQIGFAYLCNSVDDVKLVVRDNLYKGATQIKMAASGSVSGVADPLYVLEYTQEEIEAAVAVAEDFGTYVQVHVYNNAAIKRALRAGAKTIEHGSFFNEESMQMLIDKGAYWTPTIEVERSLLNSPDKLMASKAKEANDGAGAAMEIGKKMGAKILFGTDMIFSAEARKMQARELTVRKEWFTSPEIMIQATGNGGEALWNLTGQRNPYGRVGIIEEGAMADMIIVSKNFMEDVSVIEDTDNIGMIMKDGKVYKNTL